MSLKSVYFESWRWSPGFVGLPLIILRRRRNIMGELVNQRRTTVVASIVAVMIIALNLSVLLGQKFFG